MSTRDTIGGPCEYCGLLPEEHDSGMTYRCLQALAAMRPPLPSSDASPGAVAPPAGTTTPEGTDE